MPLPPNHLIDQLATAYVQALAAVAGATIAATKLDFGVDGTLKHIVQSRNGYFIESGFPVDFQLKSTGKAEVKDHHVYFELEIRNYNLIVTRSEVATPYYLFLVCFHGDSPDWLAQDRDRLILRASAFWWTSSGLSLMNKKSKVIKIPLANCLTSNAIEKMLLRSRIGSAT